MNNIVHGVGGKKQFALLSGKPFPPVRRNVQRMDSPFSRSLLEEVFHRAKSLFMLLNVLL